MSGTIHQTQPAYRDERRDTKIKLCPTVQIGGHGMPDISRGPEATEKCVTQTKIHTSRAEGLDSRNEELGAKDLDVQEGKSCS